MSTSSSALNSQSTALKSYFKTPEGRYKLQCEKTHPALIIHYSHGKTISHVTLANLKEKPLTQQPTTPTPSSGVRSAAARLLGGGNGGRTLSLYGGNGVNKSAFGSTRMSGSAGTSGGGSTGSPISSNYDGKGTYLVFNAGDTVFMSDANSQDKDPIKALHFSNSNPTCHAFDSDSKDGHDLLIGLVSGDVCLVSLRQQLQEVGKKLVGAQHFNKDGVINNSRCMSVAWVPGGEGFFVVAHADGSLYVYEKAKDGSTDSSFPAIKEQTHFAVAHARSSKSNPVARWHVCQGSLSSISFSPDGLYMATVGRDGYLRVFDYSKEQLVFGGKSYYGALLCCAWSPDGKYILTGGEDDLVQVWSMDERKLVAWGEGHNSWVSAVAFDSHWSPPPSVDTEDNVVYRFGSVGQDTQLLLWDLVIDELVVPLRRPSGGSPTFSGGSPSAHWDSLCPVGTLQPSPSMKDVPKISPLVAHRVHVEPLSGLIFTSESILTICREGQLKIWMKTAHGDTNQPSTSETALGASILKDKPAVPSPKACGSSFKQTTPILG